MSSGGTEFNIPFFCPPEFALITSLTTNMAHEINDSLTVIACATEILGKIHREGSNEINAELINDIEHSINRISYIIKNFENCMRQCYQSFSKAKVTI
ncbi:MAG: hypothetical protein HQK53_15660 [Oligoflexia bacterium]|nr:hypothetical protein [Oligoflexia bacterium]